MLVLRQSSERVCHHLKSKYVEVAKAQPTYLKYLVSKAGYESNRASSLNNSWQSIGRYLQDNVC